MQDKLFKSLILALLLYAFPVIKPDHANAQTWYRSNPAGMALERTASRMVALHHPWALSVQRINRNALPELLLPFHRSAYIIEQRILYERGKLKRRQYIFRSGGVTRVNASLPADLSDIGKTKQGEVPPFIEIFGADRSLVEMRQYLANGIYITKYTYRNSLLLRAESYLDDDHLWTDTFRYTRADLLRRVERVYYGHVASIESVQGASTQPPSPELPSALDLRDAPPVPGFVQPGSPYDNSIMTEVLLDIYSIPAARAIYDTDAQGRVISETRYDDEDEVIALLANEWSGDRISAINWTFGEDEGRIVFRYSGKDRVGEENYRNGVLERTVRKSGNTEIEEIYLNGKAILRATWEDGRKVLEERLR